MSYREADAGAKDQDGFDVASLQEYVGQVVTYTAPEPLGRASIRYFSEAVGDANPLYLDVHAGVKAGLGGVVAPPTLVCESTQYTGRDRDENGYAGHAWDLPLPPVQRIRGGNRYCFLSPVGPETQLTVHWALESIESKNTRSGQEMLVSRSKATFCDENGAELVHNHETMFYRRIGDR